MNITNPLIVSLSIYFSNELSKYGQEVFDVVQSMKSAFPECEPIKFRASRTDIRRNRYFRINEKNLNTLKKELIDGLIYHLEMNDNLGSEKFAPQDWYKENRWNFIFRLDLSRRRPHGLLETSNELPLYAQLVVNYNCLEPSSRVRLWDICRRMLVWLNPMLSDVYTSSNANVCLDHLLGVISESHDAVTGVVTSEVVLHPPVEAMDTTNNIIIVDKAPLLDEYCDVLLRDAYPGMFLNQNHIKLLGGVETIKRDMPYEIIEDIGNGLFMLVSSDPSDWSEQEVKEKIAKCREFIAPISMLSLADDDYDVFEAKVDQLRKRLGLK